MRLYKENSSAGIKLCNWIEVMAEGKRLSSINNSEVFVNCMKHPNK